MSKSGSGQRFIGQNRGPRVHIEYDVEVQGEDKKVKLPFVNGVIADLSGDNRASLPSILEREFMEVDSDNFDDRLRAIAPFVELNVPNKLTGEGDLELKLDIRQMDDFSPGAVARNIEPLCQLLDARNQLANLMTYMDGKCGAEQLITELLANNELMNSLCSSTPGNDVSASSVENEVME
ncbi:Uncharacterized protein conserved in bacteria [Serratia proteamaculans]|uniref:type VI secretion system contractile sheath small subunit n=1 Tax=Serratia proteamaculans TaxID=28151 RepID=UPI002183A170|nr:type VI secretion system contractile sheath small subunit [Serratia proteamaculans]CAI2398676.1 Uncharacterized protein conserved in bacteria [Serratia proteamaculans]